MSLSTFIDLIQQLELMQKYNHDKSQPSKEIFADIYMLKKDFKMFVLWTWTRNKIGKMPSLWEALYKEPKKRTIFKQYANSKRKLLKSWRKRNQYGCLFSKKQKQECRKIEPKEKDILLKVKVNNFDLDMQIDTGSEFKLIPRHFWECTGKPTLRKSSLILCQFDESVKKKNGDFEGSLELEDNFEVIPIIETTNKRSMDFFETMCLI